MDRETVITHLQIIHTWAQFARERDLQFFTAKHLEDIAKWAGDTLALLKEQEAKTPVECEDEGYWYYRCPTCEHHEDLLREWNYCPFCGQAVKWNEQTI